MIKKFTLYLGLNDKETKMQKIATVEAFKIVSNLVAKRFGGGTIFEAQGIYKHDNGVVVTETTLRIELLFAETQDVRAFVETLKEIFNQESVAVQEEDIKSDLW